MENANGAAAQHAGGMAADITTDIADLAAALMHARQTTLPKRLTAPGPDEAQLAQIVQAAASAPDHGQLTPWRFVRVPETARLQLGEVFAQALRERDASATEAQQAQAREKAQRAPLLLLVVVEAQGGDPEIDLHERIVSAGCAVQNMLLMATALGFASALTSGKALKAACFRDFFGLGAGELALCFINVGTASAMKPPRPRPDPARYLSTLA